MKNSPSHQPTGLLPGMNQFRPAAFLAVKFEILRAKDFTDCVQARKTIDRYIFGICEKSMRVERQLDLIYILNWKIARLRDDGIDTPEPQTIGALGMPIETEIHARQMYRP